MTLVGAHLLEAQAVSGCSVRLQTIPVSDLLAQRQWMRKGGLYSKVPDRLIFVVRKKEQLLLASCTLSKAENGNTRPFPSL